MRRTSSKTAASNSSTPEEKASPGTWISFIYHFYPVLPLYYLIIAGALAPLWEAGGSGRRAAGWFFLFSLALLVIFYPVLSGLEVPAEYANPLRLFPVDWVF